MTLAWPEAVMRFRLFCGDLEPPVMVQCCRMFRISPPQLLTFVVEWYGKLRTFAKNLEFREALIRG
ncbi:MAG: hypothetical protein PWP61_717 [Trichococcus sp.]|jgi:hypothetical protein|nr:hypothetical protein [Trichococcus sp.]